jgi:hypothetical protein
MVITNGISYPSSWKWFFIKVFSVSAVTQLSSHINSQRIVGSPPEQKGFRVFALPSFSCRNFHWYCFDWPEFKVNLGKYLKQKIQFPWLPKVSSVVVFVLIEIEANGDRFVVVYSDATQAYAHALVTYKVMPCTHSPARHRPTACLRQFVVNCALHTSETITSEQKYPQSMKRFFTQFFVNAEKMA